MTGVGLAAVLFDLDGLLIDSEPVWFTVEEEVVQRLGGSWDHDHQAACMGGTIDKTCDYILTLTGSSMSAADLQADLLAAMVEQFHAGVPIHEGALALINVLADAAVPMGVVSSSYRVLVDAALANLDRDRFDVTVSGDEVRRGKPDPEPYALACRSLGVDPAQTVVLEDALLGVTSAERAGCRVVAVPERAAITAAPGRRVVGSLTEVTLDLLREVVG